MTVKFNGEIISVVNSARRLGCDAGAFTQLGDECLEAGFLFCRWNFFFKVANQANADGVLVES